MTSMTVAAAVPRPMLLRSNRWSMTNFAGTSVAMPGTAEGHGDHEVVELHDAGREQHGRGDDHRAGAAAARRKGRRARSECRRSRAAFQRSASTPRRPGKQDGHGQAGAVPEAGDDNGVDRHRLVHDPVEGEARRKPRSRTSFCRPSAGLRNHCQATPVTTKDIA